MGCILITGASSGIGAACARLLAPRHSLVLVARRGDRLDLLRRSPPGDHHTIVADLATPAGIATAAAAAQRLDGLVNNAGIFATAAADAIDATHLQPLLRLNVEAPMLLTAACLPRLTDGATIVNISSVVVDNAFLHCAAYTASKCALEGWSRCLREELRPRRIRVSIVAPGATDTEIWPTGLPAERRARMTRAEDVAEAVRAALEAHPSASLDRIGITPPGGPL